MIGSTIKITPSDGVSYDCLVTAGTTQSQPALIIFSPIFGVDDDMAKLAEVWAARGYIVAVPDYYHRVGGGVLGRDEEGRGAAVTRWKALSADQVISDTRPLIDYLKASPACNGRIGALGICAGGELAFLAATRLGVDAVVTCHGTHIDRHVSKAAGLTIPVDLHYGDADTLVPMAKVTAVQSALASNPKATIHVYAGAEHGFSFAGRPSHHEVGATEADRSAQDIFGSLKAAAA